MDWNLGEIIINNNDNKNLKTKKKYEQNKNNYVQKLFSRNCGLFEPV